MEEYEESTRAHFDLRNCKNLRAKDMHAATRFCSHQRFELIAPKTKNYWHEVWVDENYPMKQFFLGENSIPYNHTN